MAKTSCPRIATSVSSLSVLFLCSCGETRIDYDDFQDLSKITLNGSAAGINGDENRTVLHLTNDYWQSGSAFLADAIVLNEQSSFSSYFQFRIDDARGLGDGADGLVFVVQTQAANVGGTGGSIGFGGIRPSVGVEFDTYPNEGDPNGNHIGIDLNGSMRSIAQATPPGRMDDGSVWHAWVDYDGARDLLEARISQNADRPPTAVVSSVVDLVEVFGSDSVYVGFTSGTGAGAGNHSILRWRFSTRFKGARSDDRVQWTIEIPRDAPNERLAVGDVFTVLVEVEGRDMGPRIEVLARLGDKELLVPATRVLPDEEGVADETGPWLYETGEIEVFAGSDPNDARNIVAVFGEETDEMEVAGITGPVLVSLLEDYITRAGRARHPLEAFVLFEKAAALVAEADDAGLYHYASQLLQAASRESVMPELFRAQAEEFRSLTSSMLNDRLRRHLDDIAGELMDDAGGGNASEVRIRRALALLKETALAQGIERLMELNRWKVGSGVIADDTFLAYDRPDMMERIRKMDDADAAVRFLETNGIANAEDQTQTMRAEAVRFAQQNGDRLNGIWARMEKAREWYDFAQNQTNLVFDWDPSRRRYANDYLTAERQYKELLRDNDLLRTIVENSDGDEVPLWRAIAESQADQQHQDYIAMAVDRTERSVREMVGNIVEMRTVDDLAALGSPRYKELHTMAAGYQARIARPLVGLANNMYQEEADESYWENAAWDFGLGVVQIGGVFFPPAFYAATAVQVTRRGGESIAAYAESGEAEAAEGAGMGSRLAADNARRHFRQSVGNLAMEVAFGALDYSAIRALRASRAAGASSRSISELYEIGRDIKQQWAAQRRFQSRIGTLERRIQRAEEFGVKKQAAIGDWDRKIKNALRNGDEPLRTQRMTKRANDQRILVRWNQLARRSTGELQALRQRGPSIGRSPTFYATQGQDVERATLLFYERLSSNPGTADYVQKIGDRRFQLGERIEGTVGGIQRRRFEVRFNERIVDAEGRVIRPPKLVHLPGEAVPVRNTLAGRRKHMEFDRIIIDHRDGVVYLEDLIRTGNREHLIKTHSYADGLERMFPGYSVAGVARPGVGAWPRDVVWGNMNSPIGAVSADLRPYRLQAGENLLGR